MLPKLGDEDIPFSNSKTILSGAACNVVSFSKILSVDIHGNYKAITEKFSDINFLPRCR